MNFTYKQIWLINYPVMISLLMEQAVNLTDTIFLGRIGETELGACAVAGMYYTAIYMLGFGFSLGLQVIIAKHNGEGDYQRTGRFFYQGIYFQILLAALTFLLSQLFSPILLRYLISSEQVYTAVIQYVHWRNYSFLLAFPLLAIRAFFIGTTNTYVLTGNSILMVVCNILFNYTLIFGSMGFPRLGIAGAAIASSLAELVGLIALAIHLWQRVDHVKYGILPLFDLQMMIQLIKLSSWTMLRSFFCIAPWFVFFIAIEYLGERQLAAANVVRSISMLFFIIVNSFATTGISLVSNLLGAQQPQSIIPVCRKVICLSFLTGTPLILTAFLFANEILGIFTTDTAVIETAFYPYLVMLSTYVLSVPAYTFCNAVIGTGNTKIAFGFQLITIVVYLTYLYMLSHFQQTPLALYWTSEQLYVILLFILSRVYMKKYK